MIADVRRTTAKLFRSRRAGASVAEFRRRLGCHRGAVRLGVRRHEVTSQLAGWRPFRCSGCTDSPEVFGPGDFDAETSSADCRAAAAATSYASDNRAGRRASAGRFADRSVAGVARNLARQRRSSRRPSNRSFDVSVGPGTRERGGRDISQGSANRSGGRHVP
jgi:hypothetical protein